MFISSAFAQTAPAAAEGGSSLLGMLPIVLMFVVLYFIMIRPQMKKQKEHRAMVEALAKGDEVVTAGGLLGRISSIGDNHLGLEIANGVEVQIQRHAVAQVLPYGMETPVFVAELLPGEGELPELTPAHLAAYDLAVEQFVAGRWDEAYAALRTLPPADRAQDFLAMHIAQHNRVAPADWNGVVKLPTK